MTEKTWNEILDLSTLHAFAGFEENIRQKELGNKFI
jgi:hypothetical protein